MTTATADPTNEALVAAHRAGDGKALDALVRRNVPLVRLLAGKLARLAAFDDLVQEGMGGLLHAVEMFDPDGGAKFATYAVWWIRARQVQFLYRDRPMPINTTPRKKVFKHGERARARLAAAGLPSDNAAVARAIGVRESDVEDTFSRMRQQGSIDDRVGWIADVSPLPDEVLEEKQAAEVRRRALGEFRAGLTPRDRVIFDARFPADGDEKETLASVGQRLGVSRERVRQVETLLVQRLIDSVRL